MNFNRLFNNLVRRESDPGELRRRIDFPEVMDRLRVKREQARRFLEFLLERYSEKAEFAWRKIKIAVRYSIKRLKTLLASIVDRGRNQAFVAEPFDLDEPSHGDFEDSRFTSFVTGLKRKFPRYANGRLFGFVTTSHQFIIQDGFQFWCGITVGLIFWLGVLSVYQWIFW